jgi:hypothetical protein
MYCQHKLKPGIQEVNENKYPQYLNGASQNGDFIYVTFNKNGVDDGYARLYEANVLGTPYDLGHERKNKPATSVHADVIDKDDHCWYLQPMGDNRVFQVMLLK